MPKKLKLGVSATWDVDASSWGKASTSIPSDSWGSWGGDSWGNTGGDIWDTASQEPAGPDPPNDWGYDDGWDGPPPDFSAEDAFPSLSATAPPKKRLKSAYTQPQTINKPADFASLLGPKASQSAWGSERERTRTSSQEGKSWIQNSISKNRTTVAQPACRANNRPRDSTQHSSEPTQSRLHNVTKQPTTSLKDLLNIPKVTNTPKETNVSKETNISKDTKPPSTTIEELDAPETEMRHQEAGFINSRDQSQLEHITSKPAQSLKDILNIPQVLQQSATNQNIVPPNSVKHQEDTLPFQKAGSLQDLELIPDHNSVQRKPIYTQLKEQLRKLSSLGKPLVYIIQNGSITVELAGV